MDQQLSLFYGLSFLTAAAAFAFAVYLYLWVKKQPLVNKTIDEVAGLIRAGANTFMGREYKILAIFAIVIAVILFVLLFEDQQTEIQNEKLAKQNRYIL